MPNITTPAVDQPIVDAQGRMTEPFRAWVQAITSLDIITGTGSPEGVVSASVGRLYMAVNGTAGSILYSKKVSGISLDPKDGWVLV